MESEDLLINRVVRALRGRTMSGIGSLRLGVGDDAAVVRSARGLDWVVSCDAFLEGVHFLAEKHPPDSIGYKALARATSDLAAMGAAPRLFLLTLAIPLSRTGRWLDRFLAGMSRAARELEMQLAGGDTTGSDKVTLSVTVLGQIAAGRALTRSGARPGDLVYVSGRLGEAKLGLDLIRSGDFRRDAVSNILQPHLYPKIRVELGMWLSRRRVASAGIDISDGLSTDLTRLVQASRVGAVIYSERIPTVRVPESIRDRFKRRNNRLEMALHGGEDYELLFTVPPRRAKFLKSAPQDSELRCIGEITRDRRILLVDSRGKARRLKPGGWDPFRS